jgi:glycosyl transferase family 87
VAVSASTQRARIGTQARGVTELALCTVPALIAPLVLLQYLFGDYKAHPYTMDGKYFPDGGFLFDLHELWRAGHEVVLGHSPYPFVYPAPAAILMAPFGALPWSVAVGAFAVVAIAAVVFALRSLGVRDWRCYGLAIGWLPVASTTTLGALSTLLALGAALAWRYRDRRLVVPAAVAAVVAVKVFLWPLLIWLVATRRFRAAASSVVMGVVLAVGCWAVIGFDGMLSYPRHIGEIASSQQGSSYSPYALLRALGVSTTPARLALVALTIAVIGAIVLLARRPDGDRRAFAAAVGAALVASPIVWLHYFVLLYVVVALYRKRATAAWFLPLAFWLVGHQDSAGSTARIFAAYAIAAATVALAISPSLPSRWRRSVPAREELAYLGR